ncbi:zinc finger Ran-binding domain-containing protein 2-like [Varroa jacobsoni]|uniref:Zinc finger Ran-binding domain-containing protein 2 n=1 Tax=Varroa destructor TaxID=109461 RepID=A0A7M7JXF6_VARDE|nr:zinc finger Ran-binding domain-containing protein 2-like [Varroa destructor]XP_022710580.1 zinc finger Ran-binding domain-containing protein 2-like [Varroa jacobsoni]
MSGSSFHLPDWQCPDEKCRNVNFGKRTACNRCGVSRPREVLVNATKKIGHEIGKQAAEKSHGLFSADDWQCGKCGNVNWARRNNCNMCSAPKVGEVERRTGLGGGYNEREGVEYKQRPANESDDEYDDFGRKKRRKPKDSDCSNSNLTRDRSRSPLGNSAQGRRDNHDDDNDGDDIERQEEREPRPSKDNGRDWERARDRDRNREQDEEEDESDNDRDDDDDEDDDDDDADLSKYDLLA